MTNCTLFKSIASAQILLLLTWLPSQVHGQTIEGQEQKVEIKNAENELTGEQARERIMRLEAELIMLKRSLGMDRQNRKIVLPKQGVYVQADIGLQQREFAGENGVTNLMFDPGLYGGVGVGYRYDRNFRFGFEYSQMNNAVSKIRPGIPIPVVDPILGPVGTNGAQFPANGTVKLDSYTLNAYYDLNGFGFEKRFRPYLGAGVGLMTSTISNLQPAFFPSIGVNRALNGENTQPTFNFQAGLAYLFKRNTEFYLGGQYSYTSTFLFQNTDFGTLMPNGARNWTLKTGVRYTF
jgi:opacity protein-like surface antigen